MTYFGRRFPIDGAIPWNFQPNWPEYPPHWDNPIPDCECGESEEDCAGECYEFSLTQHLYWLNGVPEDENR